MKIDPALVPQGLPTTGLTGGMTGGMTSDLIGERTAGRLDTMSRARNPAEADKAAREFEAYFVQYMLKEMRKTISYSDLLGGRQTMEIFESMFDEAVGKAVSEGKGLGLADELRESLGGEAGGHPPTRAPHPSEVLRRYGATGPLEPVRIQDDAEHRARALSPLQKTLDEAGLEPRLTSAFGARTHPITGKSHVHTGIDVAVPEGTPIYAAAAGTVVFSGERGGYGNLVIVDHGNGYTSRYAHNEALRVTEGQKVGTETVLAESGSTGRSTGPHLHFEVRKDGVPVDPGRVRWNGHR